jgi:uncharacterized protein (TIGR02118 family)
MAPVKIVSVIKRRSDLSFEQFVAHWQDRHAPFVARLPGLLRYIQSPALQHARRTWPWDGMAELWFEDVYAIKLAFESPAADNLREDEKHFIGDQQWFIATDHPILATMRPSTEQEPYCDEHRPQQTG